jgi:hypothetical protein
MRVLVGVVCVVAGLASLVFNRPFERFTKLTATRAAESDPATTGRCSSSAALVSSCAGCCS